MANWEEIKQEYETTKITLAKLAEKHGIPLGTIKSQKSRDTKAGNSWVRDGTKKDATKGKKVATKKEDADEQAQRKRSGNPNPSNQFTKRNKAAETHGFFSKWLPEETLEIIEAMNERSPADLIWDQIQIQYAAIIRAQRIMFVESKDEMIKELKKFKPGQFGDEEEYNFQFAWERQAQLLTAQSRAIGELRSSIRQFVEMADQDDERRLKLEQMQLNIDKTRAEIAKIEKPEGDKQESEIAKMLRRMAGDE